MYITIRKVDNQGHGGRWTDQTVNTFQNNTELRKYLLGRADLSNIKVYKAEEVTVSLELKIIEQDHRSRY